MTVCTEMKNSLALVARAQMGPVPSVSGANVQSQGLSRPEPKVYREQGRGVKSFMAKPAKSLSSLPQNSRTKVSTPREVRRQTSHQGCVSGSATQELHLRKASISLPAASFKRPGGGPNLGTQRTSAVAPDPRLSGCNASTASTATPGATSDPEKDDLTSLEPEARMDTPPVAPRPVAPRIAVRGALSPLTINRDMLQMPKEKKKEVSGEVHRQSTPHMLTDSALEKSQKLLEQLSGLGLWDEECGRMLDACQETTNGPAACESEAASPCSRTSAWPTAGETAEVPLEIIKMLKEMWQHICELKAAQASPLEARRALPSNYPVCQVHTVKPCSEPLKPVRICRPRYYSDSGTTDSLGSTRYESDMSTAPPTSPLSACSSGSNQVVDRHFDWPVSPRSSSSTQASTCGNSIVSLPNTAAVNEIFPALQTGFRQPVTPDMSISPRSHLQSPVVVRQVSTPALGIGPLASRRRCHSSSCLPVTARATAPRTVSPPATSRMLPAQLRVQSGSCTPKNMVWRSVIVTSVHHFLEAC